jgi:hypothetical protein
MAKLTLDDIASGYATTTKINANNAAIETAMENTLSRDGTGPNQMNANLDMNGYKVSNLAAPTASSDAARLVDLTNSYSLQAAPSPVGQNGKGLVSNGTILTYATILSDASSLNASNLLTGTIPDARFPATLPAVSGLNLTNLNATNLGSGTVNVARLPATLARTDVSTNFTVNLQVFGYDVGYKDIVSVSSAVNYAITSTDRGKLIISTANGWTLPTTAADTGFAVGAAVSIYNASGGNLTLTCPTGMTLYVAGTATGGLFTNRTMANRGLATLVKVASGSWVISGAGIS